MKKSITDYLYTLSEDNYDILYEIIHDKYRKFIHLYWLLKEYSDNIVALSYKEKTGKDKLKIVVTFSGIDSQNVANELQSNIDSDSILIEIKKKDLHIEIFQEEKDV